MQTTEIRRGIRTGLPIALGYFPVAVTFGILARQVGLSVLETTGMSVWVFAGASQFIALTLLHSGVSATQIILTTFMINLRHFIMSTALAQKMKPHGLITLSIGFGVTDETFVVAGLKPDLTPRQFLPIFILAYLGWVSGSLVGNLFAAIIPASIVNSMGIGLYALFIALLVPEIKDSRRAGIIAGISAAAAWSLSKLIPDLSLGWIVVIATLSASAVGMLFPSVPQKSTDTAN